MAEICKDKEYSFELLHKRITMPKTIEFLNYIIKEEYRKYV